MRIVVQNVLNANVKVDGKIVGVIQRGFLVYVGFCSDDNELIVDKMVDKLINLRVFQDNDGLTNLSINDIDGDILSISQFTLYADASKGRRPSFTNALNQNDAKKLYDYFNAQLECKFKKIQTGIFRADMKVSSVNDGPFTILLDSRDIIKK